MAANRGIGVSLPFIRQKGSRRVGKVHVVGWPKNEPEHGKGCGDSGKLTTIYDVLDMFSSPNVGRKIFVSAETERRRDRPTELCALYMVGNRNWYDICRSTISDSR